jgi:hypothetical protein
MLNREQATPLIALVVTLTVAHGLKLHLNNNLSLDNFNKPWMISVGGLLAGNLVNILSTSKILDKVAADTRFVKNGDRNSLGFILMKDIIETCIMLLTSKVFISVMNGQDVQITAGDLRNMFLALSGILFYDIVIRPMITDNMKYAKYIREVTRKTMSIAAADYMSDLDFDNFGIEAGTTAAGIVIGDLSSTPLANQVFGDSSVSQTSD